MLPSAGDIYTLQSIVLRALASPRRLEILHLLERGPLTVQELGHALDVSQPVVSAHLAALRGVGLVDPARDGRNVRYQLTDPRIVTACSMVRDVLTCRLERLNRAVGLAEFEPAAGPPEPSPDRYPIAQRS